jgi:hypothetical protein
MIESKPIGQWIEEGQEVDRICELARQAQQHQLHPEALPLQWVGIFFEIYSTGRNFVPREKLVRCANEVWSRLGMEDPYFEGGCTIISDIFRIFDRETKFEWPDHSVSEFLGRKFPGWVPPTDH